MPTGSSKGTNSTRESKSQTTTNNAPPNADATINDRLSPTILGAASPWINTYSLNFSNNQVHWLPEFANESALVTIDGSYNNLQSIAGLGGFSKLNHVYMDYNNIKSVNALATCYNLIKVSVMGNPVKDVSALTNMDVIVNYNPL